VSVVPEHPASRLPVGVNLAQSGPLGGYVAQLAVRRDQRGRGLGLACSATGSGSSTAEGFARSTSTSTSENRTGATRLYERAGMRVQHRYDSWVKDVR
jgi:mycothiol synthase